MFYSITLNPAIDYIFQVDQIKLNQTNRTIAKSSDYFKNNLDDQKIGNYRIGGKGLNVGIFVLNHKMDAKILFANSSTSQEFVNYLINKEIDLTNFISFNAIDTMRINSKIMCNQKMTEINDHNYIHNQNLYIEILDYLETNLKPNDYVSLNGSFPIYVHDHKNITPFGINQKEIEENFAIKLAKLVVSKKAHLILDTSASATLAALQFKPLFIKPNLEELFAFFNQPVGDLETAKKYVKQILNQGCQNVLLSLGENGACLFFKNQYVQASVLNNLNSKNIVSFQGCGDSMVGAFVAFHAQNKIQEMNSDLATQILFYSLAAGTTKAYQNHIPNKQEIDQYYKYYQNSKNFSFNKGTIK